MGVALADKMLGREHGHCLLFWRRGSRRRRVPRKHESWRRCGDLPVLFVCENNLYAMGMALKRAEAETDLSRKAAGYRMPGVAVDGMDVVAVESAARSAIAQIRSGDGPQLLECRTYRFRAHSMFDAQLYRAKDEIEAWRRERADCAVPRLAGGQRT